MDPDPGSRDGKVSSSSQAADAEAQLASQVMLAEYAALRAEVDRRANVQWNVLALQLTSAGVIASLAISHVSDIALLLVIPLSSYMLGSRYILHDFHIKLISRYIRDSLSGRLRGWPAQANPRQKIRHSYSNNPFRTVRSRDAERHFLSRWLSSGECAAKFCSPELSAWS